MKHTYSVPKWLLLFLIASFATAAAAQKSGGTLRAPLRENPGSASLHEESSISAVQTFMPVYNNLVVFDQQDKVARPESIKPDLATSWAWSPDNTVLTLKLREGVKWHDGKPFTSADVQCTWDTIKGKRDAHWRKNSHKEWYENLKEVTVNGPYEVRFVLGRPQPAFMSFLASGWSPVYPCHVDGRVMRQKPIGTGPFKVEEFKPNDVIRLVKNRDYWKPGRPYLDAIEWRIMPSQATRVLTFITGQADMSGTSTVNTNTQKDILAKVPKAICNATGSNVVGVVLMNHKVAPYDNPKVRRAISLALDRREFVKATQGEGRFGGNLMAPPFGVWGLTPAQLETVPGGGKNVEKNRAEARKLMQEAGYGPNNKLKTSFFVRASSPAFLLGATLAADQLRTIYIDGDIAVQEYSMFTAALIKGAYQMAFETSGTAVDDPDAVFYEMFKCASIRNYTKYCSRDIEAKIDEQSAMMDPVKRKKLAQAIDLQLQNEVARVPVYQSTSSACWHPYVKGYVRSINGIYTHHRMEDVWLDK